MSSAALPDSPLTAESRRRADPSMSQASVATETSSAAADRSAGAGIEASMSATTPSAACTNASISTPIPNRSDTRSVWIPSASSTAAVAAWANSSHVACSPERAACAMQAASPGPSPASASDLTISATAPTSGSTRIQCTKASTGRPASCAARANHSTATLAAPCDPEHGVAWQYPPNRDMASWGRPAAIAMRAPSTAWSAPLSPDAARADAIAAATSSRPCSMQR